MRERCWRVSTCPLRPSWILLHRDRPTVARFFRALIAVPPWRAFLPCHCRAPSSCGRIALLVIDRVRQFQRQSKVNVFALIPTYLGVSRKEYRDIFATGRRRCTDTRMSDQATGRFAGRDCCAPEVKKKRWITQQTKNTNQTCQSRRSANCTITPRTGQRRWSLSERK